MASVVYSSGRGLVEYSGGAGFSIDPGTGVDSNGLMATFIPAAAPETLSSSGAASVECHMTYLDATSGTVSATLASGKAVGQVKKFMMVSDGSDATVAVATGCGVSSVLFTNAGDLLEMIWTKVGWQVLAAHNVAAGNALSPAVS